MIKFNFDIPEILHLMMERQTTEQATTTKTKLTKIYHNAYRMLLVQEKDLLKKLLKTLKQERKAKKYVQEHAIKFDPAEGVICRGIVGLTNKEYKQYKKLQVKYGNKVMYAATTLYLEKLMEKGMEDVINASNPA